LSQRWARLSSFQARLDSRESFSSKLMSASSMILKIVLPDGALVLVGSFMRRVDFGIGSESDAHNAVGYSDAYLSRFTLRASCSR
jgi:hypothetical protein